MKYKLCKECSEIEYCNKVCKSAVKFEKQDSSKNYSTERYIARNTFTPFYRGSGGISKFK